MVDAYLMERMIYLLKTEIIYVKDDKVVPIVSSSELNPLCQSREIRNSLMERAGEMRVPYVMRDELEVYYSCILDREGGCYLVGPMTTQYLDRVSRHKFYKKHRIKEDLEKNLPVHSVTEVLLAVCILNYMINGEQLTNNDLVSANGLTGLSRQTEDLSLLRFDLKTEAEEEIEYRHTYQDERKMMDTIRDGNVAEALRLSALLEKDVGRLGKTEVEHWRNFLIIDSTLSARAAIDAGVQPALAYRISGFYINEASQCEDTLRLIGYKRHMTETFAKLVYDHKHKRHASSYTQQCKDYVRMHFKEKIYLEDIAQLLNISPSYLSRLFREETGQRLQDYIVDVRVDRAANLLIYSQESIPRIAEYVNFPSQSYFGKVFKARMHMTPRQYREANKPTEFIERQGV